MAQIFKPSKQNKLDAKHYAIDIERLDHQGVGIGFVKRKPVFVEGALAGEKVVVQNTQQKSKFVKAKLIKRLTDSKARVQPFCPHYEECGGCNLQHLNHLKQVELKQQGLSQQMKKFANCSASQQPAIESQTTGYRRRARLSCFWDKKQHTLSFGFRAKQSSRIVDIQQCSVLTPLLQSLLIPVKACAIAMDNPRSLGHVELIEADSGAVLLLRITQALSERDNQLWTALAVQHKVTLYLQPTDQPLELVCGEAPYYEVDDLKLEFLPSDFIQVNPQVNQAMVEQGMNWLDLQPEDAVLDLFCGVGNFSLPLAKRVKRVIGIEGVPEMVARATRNAELNQMSNLEFIHANLEEYSLAQVAHQQSGQGAVFSKVLLDPARAGAAGVMPQLVEMSPTLILYVSCDPTTMSRDSKVLLDNGYQLAKMGIMNMFPHTAHVESMALFELTKKK